MRLISIASLTLVEALRRRVVAVASMLTLAVIGATVWGLDRLTHAPLERHGRTLTAFDISAVDATIIVLLAYMFSVVLALGAAFLSAGALAGDIESGVFLAVLPRPVRRSEIVAGKWLGLSALVACFACVFGGLEVTVFAVMTRYLPPHPLLALGFLIGQAIVSITLGLALSARVPTMAAGIGAIAGFGISWIAGITTTIATALGNRAVEDAGTAVGLLLPSDFLWRGTLYALEPTAILALQSASQNGLSQMGPFSIAGPPTPAALLWTLAWTCGVFAAAIAGFARRDI